MPVIYCGFKAQAGLGENFLQHFQACKHWRKRASLLTSVLVHPARACDFSVRPPPCPLATGSGTLTLTMLSLIAAGTCRRPLRTVATGAAPAAARAS